MNWLVVILCVGMAAGCATDSQHPGGSQDREEFSCAQIRHQLERIGRSTWSGRGSIEEKALKEQWTPYEEARLKEQYAKRC